DSDHSRIVQHLVNGSTVTDTIYLNDPISGAMSEVSVTGGTTTWHDYIKADGRLVAERSCTGAAPCSTGETWNYFARDHLGSISVITDATGAALSTGGQLSFDSWGRQRNVNGSDDLSCSLSGSEPTTRGFTAQETLPSYCLVNLHARVYDPTIARMMSPDSIVPNPLNGGSFNRYSYVNNRPLSFTDPSGHQENGDGNKVPPPPPSCYNGGWNCTTGTLFPYPDRSINVQTGDWLGFDTGGTSPGGWGGGGSLAGWDGVGPGGWGTTYTQNGYTLYTSIPDPSGSNQIETVLATYWYEPAYIATNFGITNSIPGGSNGSARQGGAILVGAGGA